MWRVHPCSVLLVSARVVLSFMAQQKPGPKIGETFRMTAILRPFAVLTVMLGLFAAMAAPAEAGRRHHHRNLGVGIVAGIIGLGILGAIGNSHRYRSGPVYRSRGGCYQGPRRCRWTRGHCWTNRWGERVCRGGVKRCWRPTYCD